MADLTQDNYRQLEAIQDEHCSDPPTDALTPFQRFTNLARGVFNVPKEEVDAAEADWKAEQALREKRPGRKAMQ